MRGIGRFVVTMVVASLGFVPSTLARPQTAPAPEAPAGPYVGEVTGESVNLRAQNTEGAWSLRKLEKGERLVVLSESSGWLKVRVPLGYTCWVAKQYVDDGKDGFVTVNADRVNLRPAPSAKQFPLNYVDKGTKLRLVSCGEDWVEVAAPEDLPVWVAAPYVKRIGSEESLRSELASLRGEADKRYEQKRIDAEKAAVTAAREKEVKKHFQTAEDLVSMENAKPSPEYAPALSLYEQIQKETEDASLKETVKSRIEEIGRLQKLKTELQEARAVGNRLEGELEQTRKQYEQELESLKRVVKHEKPRELEIGWVVKLPRLDLVDKTGPDFKLVKGGTTLCYLQSTKYDLRDFVEKQVCVAGDVVRKPDLDSRLVVVKDLEVVSAK
jgi:SH3-like domain-containing protein